MRRLVVLFILFFSVNGMAGSLKMEFGGGRPETGMGNVELVTVNGKSWRQEAGDRNQRAGSSSSILRQSLKKAPDEWIAYDKAQHLTASMILTGLAAYRLAHYSDWGRDASLRGGAGFTLDLGILKEISDLHKPFPYNRFSLKDLVADLAGIALGVLLLGWW